LGCLLVAYCTFRGYITEGSFTNETEVDRFGNDNGWVIYYTQSPDDFSKEILVIFDRSVDSTFVANVPKKGEGCFGFTGG